jgi:pheromone shutdown-related protein TraB
MKTITQLSENVLEIRLSDKTVILVGTAHVSRQSAELVEKTIDEIKPDTICVELCDKRLSALQNPAPWQDTDIFNVIKSGRSYVLMAQLVLAAFQKKLAKQFGIQPGQEMRQALEAAKKYSIHVEAVDRDIRTTLRRAWAKASYWSIGRLLFSLVGSLSSSHDIKEEDIEAMKSGDALTALLAEFSEYLPDIKEPLIDERDKYLAAKIAACPGNKVVAVVGAGHVPGIKEWIGKEIDLESLDVVPPPSNMTKLISWSVPVSILLLFIVGFQHSGAETSVEMAKVWILATGSLAALGTALALAHPLSILAAFIAAPITTLNPALAAGWVAGLVEAYVRKPRVKDFETIADDLSSVKGLWKNQVSKILLVVAFANLGAMAGMFIGAGGMLSLLR